jgi:pyruvate dehydrogenase E2 component (dihydrolipoamide acetyltransferase)
LLTLGAQGLRMAAINVDMPALSSTMKEGKIVQWTVKEGDKVLVVAATPPVILRGCLRLSTCGDAVALLASQVSAGDVIMVVESDKADMDVEAFEDGYMAKIMTPEGESAIVGSTVAVIAETQEEISTVAASAGSAPAPAAAADAPAAAAAAGGAPYDGPSISMPALSSTMKEGKIVQWTVKEGDKVRTMGLKGSRGSFH